MSETGKMFVEAASRVLQDWCTEPAYERADAGGIHADLWQKLEEGGFTSLLVPEDQGGVGASLADAVELLRLAGRHGAPVPLAETMVASWVLSQAGLPAVRGPLTLALGADGSSWKLSNSSGKAKLTGSQVDVPWGLSATVVVVAQQGEEAVVGVAKPGRISGMGRSNIAGEPRDNLAARALGITAMATTRRFSRDQVLRHIAIARAGMMVGALGHALEMSVRYVRDRKQFGRPLGKFQAVQQQLAVLAGEVAASSAITDAAVARVDQWDGDLLVAAARARLADAVDKVSIAHQVHGAIGFTREYALHLNTRRLWAWRDEYGSALHWREMLGRHFIGTPADDLWPRLAAVGREEA